MSLHCTDIIVDLCKLSVQCFLKFCFLLSFNLFIRNLFSQKAFFWSSFFTYLFFFNCQPIISITISYHRLTKPLWRRHNIKLHSELKRSPDHWKNNLPIPPIILCDISKTLLCKAPDCLRSRHQNQISNADFSHHYKYGFWCQRVEWSHSVASGQMLSGQWKYSVKGYMMEKRGAWVSVQFSKGTEKKSSVHNFSFHVFLYFSIFFSVHKLYDLRAAIC